MAEIQKRTETVITNYYRLDLSQEEAEVLSSVLSLVAGSFDGYRGVADGILRELRNEGAGWDGSAPSFRLTGTLRFQDTK